MGRLQIAVVECNCKQVDRQLKEQFIHELNDRVMLDEIVRELTEKNNIEQIKGEDILLWARRIEAQRAQAAILNDITEAQKFDKVKLVQKPKGRQEAETTRHTYQRHPCKYSGGKSCTKAMSSIWENMYWLWENYSLPEGVHEQKELHSP